MADHHRRGGLARAAGMTAEERSRAASRAILARWSRQKYAGLERDWGLFVEPLREAIAARGGNPIVERLIDRLVDWLRATPVV